MFRAGTELEHGTRAAGSRSELSVDTACFLPTLILGDLAKRPSCREGEGGMDGEGKGPRGKNTQNASEQLQFAEGASKGQRGSRELGSLLKLLVPQSTGLE